MPATPFRAMLGQGNNDQQPQAQPVNFDKGRADSERQMKELDNEMNQIEMKHRNGQATAQDLHRYRSLNQIHSSLQSSYEASKSHKEALDTGFDVETKQKRAKQNKSNLLEHTNIAPE